jgi:hypothetical protein
MNWRLISLLSLFGLVMAFATVFVISSKVEPFCWLAIFIFCAYMIARNAPGRFFLHGFMVSLVNCVWITAAHVTFFHTYWTNHPDMANMSSGMAHPRRMMLLIGPATGIASGLVLGLFSFIAGKIMKRPGTSATA